MPKWYQFQTKPDEPKHADIWILDQIGENWFGEGETDKSFIKQLAALPAEVEAITLHINSPGGDVYQGLTIHNALKQHKAKVKVIVEGMAGSIASVIAMAGDEILMPKNAAMFIHDPWTVLGGDADDLREQADSLDKISQSLITVYSDRSGLSEADVKALMKGDVTLTAWECVDKGLADALLDEVKIAANYDGKVFALEQSYKSQLKAKDKRIEALSRELSSLKVDAESASVEQVYQQCKAHGLEGYSADLIEQKIKQSELFDTMARVKGLVSACQTAGVEAKAFIPVMCDPVALLQRALVEANASQDQDINSHISPETGRIGSGLNAFDIYHNRLTKGKSGEKHG